MRARQSKVTARGQWRLGRAHMQGKDFRPLFSHGVRQLVCHRTNFKLFTHTHTGAEFSFACVCVLWFELNFGTHTHTHTDEHGKYYSRQQKAWTSGGGDGGRCNVSSIVTNVVAQRPLPTTPPPPTCPHFPVTPFRSPHCRSITFCFSTFGSLRQSFVILVVVVADIVIVVVGQACTIYTHESSSVCVGVCRCMCVCHTQLCLYVQSSVRYVHIICIAVCVRVSVCVPLYECVFVYVCASVCVCVAYVARRACDSLWSARDIWTFILFILNTRFGLNATHRRMSGLSLPQPHFVLPTSYSPQTPPTTVPRSLPFALCELCCFRLMTGKFYKMAT